MMFFPSDTFAQNHFMPSINRDGKHLVMKTVDTESFQRVTLLGVPVVNILSRYAFICSGYLRFVTPYSVSAQFSGE